MKPVAVILLCLPIVVGSASAAENPSAEEVTDRLRTSLEEQFRAGTGLGFSSFQCDLQQDSPPGREITCRAEDEEGDRFSYRIILDETGNSSSVSSTQPVSQLDEAGLELIERPCLVFLDAFRRGAWDVAYRELSEDFRSGFSLADLETTLAPMRDVLGELESVKADTYGSPSPGLHQLEYSLSTSGGDAVARFRLRFLDDRRARIVAFLVTARPGSELQARLVSDAGRQALAPVLWQPVRRIDAPLDKLERIGDAVEGQAILESGAEIPIRVEQQSTVHDFDSNDYRFQILDVPWLIRRYLVSIGDKPAEIDCPTRTAPNGGRLECVATMEDGSTRTVTLLRHGGDHRLAE
jgi:hypothetical protein